MTDIPDNVDLQWIARRVVALERDVRELRHDCARAFREQEYLATIESMKNELETIHAELGGIGKGMRRALENMEAAFIRPENEKPAIASRKAQEPGKIPGRQ